jgi:multicomponent Na+:H+ antiporter subunit G
MLDFLAAALISVGLLFFAAGSIGLLRLPDLHCRLHALTKADNLGLGLIALGIAIIDGSLLTATKLLLIWLLVLTASAASAHFIARHGLAKTEQDPPPP